MRLALKKVLVCLAVLGGATLLTGASWIPPDPHQSKIIWTQDGKHIIFSTPFQGVLAVDAAGVRLRTIPQGAPMLHSNYGRNEANFAAALSPDGKRVAYVTYDRSLIAQPLVQISLFALFLTPLDLWGAISPRPIFGAPEPAIESAALDGTGVRRLTVYKDLNGDGMIDRQSELDPVWSPEGSKIAFKSDQSILFSRMDSEDLRLSVMNADGSNVQVLAPSVSVGASTTSWTAYGIIAKYGLPEWSPDGRWIAFVGREKSDEEHHKEEGYRYILYTVQPDGSELTRFGEVLDGQHTWSWWSPDGKWLAFVGRVVNADSERRSVLFTARPNGSDLRSIAEVYGLPTWSPDGSQLAFMGGERDENGSLHEVLYTVHMDGSGLIRVAETYWSGLPAWSPDGTWLAFVRKHADENSIYVARPDGRDVRPVVRGYGGPVSWSVDGTELYIAGDGWGRYMAGMGYAVRTDGTGLRSLLTDSMRRTLAQYNRLDLTAVARSPDGSRLAFLGVPDKGHPTLFVVAQDGTAERRLVRGNDRRLFAEHSGWHDVAGNMAACAEGFVVPEPKVNPGLVADCETLLLIRDRLIEDNSYLNWSAVEPITAWDGVEVGCPVPLQVSWATAWRGVEFGCPLSLRVTRLHLGGLAGLLPSELGYLTGLKTLALAYYNWDDKAENGERKIPPELGRLADLEELRIEQSGLSGTIPSELGSLSKLRVFSLY